MRNNCNITNVRLSSGAVRAIRGVGGSGVRAVGGGGGVRGRGGGRLDRGSRGAGPVLVCACARLVHELIEEFWFVEVHVMAGAVDHLEARGYSFEIL